MNFLNYIKSTKFVFIYTLFIYYEKKIIFSVRDPTSTRD